MALRRVPAGASSRQAGARATRQGGHDAVHSTQQDPIGLAGGLNLYGYANGDPINFSDPFGLCADEQAGTDTTKAKSAQTCPAPAPEDPCTAYPSGSLLGFICNRTAPAEPEVGDVTGLSCTQTCLASYYLGYAESAGGSLTAAQMIDYLGRGHSLCYERCGYTLKDFGADFTFGTGRRARARSVSTVPAPVRPDATAVRPE